MVWPLIPVSTYDITLLLLELTKTSSTILTVGTASIEVLCIEYILMYSNLGSGLLISILKELGTFSSGLPPLSLNDT